VAVRQAADRADLPEARQAGVQAAEGAEVVEDAAALEDAGAAPKAGSKELPRCGGRSA